KAFRTMAFEVDVVGETVAGLAGRNEHDLAGDEVIDVATEAEEAQAEGILFQRDGAFFEGPGAGAAPFGELLHRLNDVPPVAGDIDELPTPAEAIENIFGRVRIVAAGEEEIDRVAVIGGGGGEEVGGVEEFGVGSEAVLQDETDKRR